MRVLLDTLSDLDSLLGQSCSKLKLTAQRLNVTRRVER